jgi:hypothetical protein
MLPVWCMLPTPPHPTHAVVKRFRHIRMQMSSGRGATPPKTLTLSTREANPKDERLRQSTLAHLINRPRSTTGSTNNAPCRSLIPPLRGILIEFWLQVNSRTHLLIIK